MQLKLDERPVGREVRLYELHGVWPVTRYEPAYRPAQQVTGVVREHFHPWHTLKVCALIVVFVTPADLGTTQNTQLWMPYIQSLLKASIASSRDIAPSVDQAKSAYHRDIVQYSSALGCND